MRPTNVCRYCGCHSLTHKRPSDPATMNCGSFWKSSGPGSPLVDRAGCSSSPRSWRSGARGGSRPSTSSRRSRRPVSPGSCMAGWWKVPSTVPDGAVRCTGVRRPAGSSSPRWCHRRRRRVRRSARWAPGKTSICPAGVARPIRAGVPSPSQANHTVAVGAGREVRGGAVRDRELGHLAGREGQPADLAPVRGRCCPTEPRRGPARRSSAGSQSAARRCPRGRARRRRARRARRKWRS